jgi:hypothetical protein
LVDLASERLKTANSRRASDRWSGGDACEHGAAAEPRPDVRSSCRVVAGLLPVTLRP